MRDEIVNTTATELSIVRLVIVLVHGVANCEAYMCKNCHPGR